ncbi:MAG: universal stress protein [Herminiimonas sp.]|nr:universal stress protein [Herminiimonas sp.]
MFHRILLPTDGSPLSEAAVQKGIQLAKTINAKVIGFHVIPEFHVITLSPVMLEDTEDEFARECKAKAEQYLAFIEKNASEAGVPCESAYVVNDHPEEAITQFAKETGCDLVAMASHGRSGVRNILVGSVTQKVLALAASPVLVFR